MRLPQVRCLVRREVSCVLQIVILPMSRLSSEFGELSTVSTAFSAFDDSQVYAPSEIESMDLIDEDEQYSERRQLKHSKSLETVRSKASAPPRSRSVRSESSGGSSSRKFTQGEELKCREMFRSFDVEGRGKLKRQAVIAMLARSLKQCNLDTQNTDATEFADLMFQEAGSSKISYKEFKQIYKRYLLNDSGGSDTHNRRSVAVLMNTKNADVAPDKVDKVQVDESLQFAVWFSNNQVAVWWMVVYFILNAASFVWKYHRYCYLRPAAFALSGRGLCIARGMAQVCLLNSFLVLLPLCRSLMGSLRDTSVLRHYIPFDHSILFHKICGYTFVVAGLIHTAGQMYSYFTRVMTAPDAIWYGSALDKSGAFPGPQPSFMDLLNTVPGWSGVVLTVASLIATPFTFKKFRRENFNWFWYSHLLYYPVYMAFTYFHGIGSWLEPTQAYLFTTIPILIFIIDRRNKVKLYTNAAPIRIRSVQLDTDAVGIVMDKPKGFENYLPGTYIVLNVPELSTFEWHPFTLTSAPDDDFLSVHIRAAGDWTNSLHALMRKSEKSGSFPNVKVDGPVGAPTQDYLHYSVVLMIGAGIGVTPFASILRDTAYQLKDSCCMNCGDVNYSTSSRRATLKKLYFHWTTRSQSSLRWFELNFNEVAALDKEGKIEIHNHLTNVKADEESANVKLAQTLMHHFTGRDMISGLQTRTRTHFGRPDWDAIFSDLVKRHPGEKIGVFFCGARSLESILSNLCSKYGTNEYATNFEFHAEKF